ncbi:hypothetical protein BGZ73_004489 [Actinomortierella ambigua]|nr:hypothetical protein BGZ73_004489 [Actinomortierella ambigua]
MDQDHHRYQSSDEEDFQPDVFGKRPTQPIFSKPIVLWNDAKGTSVPAFKTLLIGPAFGGSTFLHSLQKKTLIGTLIQPGVDLKDNTLDIDSPFNANANIYQLDADPSVAVIPVHYNVKDHDSLFFARTLLETIKADRIIVFDTLSPSTYLSGSYDIDYKLPWLRLLKTTGSQDVPQIPILEVPNLVQNLGATLLSHCEIRGKKDTFLVLSLQEALYGKAVTTKATIQGFQQALTHLGLASIAQCADFNLVQQILQKSLDKKAGQRRMQDDRLYA